MVIYKSFKVRASNGSFFYFRENCKVYYEEKQLAQTEERPYRKISDEDAESSHNPHCFFCFYTKTKGEEKNEQTVTSVKSIFGS